MDISSSESTATDVDPVNARCNDSSMHNNIVSNAKKIFGSSAVPASFGKYDAFYSSLRDSEMEQRKQQTDSIHQMHGYRGDGTCAAGSRRREGRRHHGDADVVSASAGIHDIIGGHVSLSKEIFSGGPKSAETNVSGALVRLTPLEEITSEITGDRSSDSYESVEKNWPATHAIGTESKSVRDSISVSGPQVSDEILASGNKSTEANSADTATSPQSQWTQINASPPDSDSPDLDQSKDKNTSSDLENDANDFALASPKTNSKTQTSPQREDRHFSMPTPSPVTPFASERVHSLCSLVTECSRIENTPTPSPNTSQSSPDLKSTSFAELNRGEICDSPMALEKNNEMVDTAPEILLVGDSDLYVRSDDGAGASLSRDLFSGEEIETKGNASCTTSFSASTHQPRDEPITDQCFSTSFSAGDAMSPHETVLIDDSLEMPDLISSSPHATPREESLHLPIMPTPSPTSSQHLHHTVSMTAGEPIHNPVCEGSMLIENIPDHLTAKAISNDMNDKTPPKRRGGKLKPTPTLSKRKLSKDSKLTSLPKRQKLDEMFNNLGISPAKSTWGAGVQLYNGRSIERVSKMKKCKNKFCQWEPRVHSLKAACERCWTLASSDEREDFIVKGRHLRIAMSKGGCPPSCTLFSNQALATSTNDSRISKSNDEAVRLCRRCFADMHHVGIR